MAEIHCHILNKKVSKQMLSIYYLYKVLLNFIYLIMNYKNTKLHFKI